MDDFTNSVTGWLKRPFREDGTVIDWLLFFGLAAVAAILWQRVLKRVLD